MTKQSETTPDPATRCRRLLRGSMTATLATADRDNDSWPYASLVQVAVTHEGAPLLLLSDLADHTRNFLRDNRVSLLFDDARGLANPMTGARVTLQGRIAKLDGSAPQQRMKGRYLARHPDASDYTAFADFNFYQVVPERLHLVAGFGQIHWLAAAEVMLDASRTGTLAEEEDGIVAHMNAEHADAVDLYAAAVLADPPPGWRLAGIDPEGIDLRREGATCRLDFDTVVSDADAARRELVRLLKAIRAAKGLAGKG